MSLIEEKLICGWVQKELFIPYDKVNIISKLFSFGQIIHQEYSESGIRVMVKIDKEWSNIFAQFEI
jgi:50S ribosomal subunit-associated GTPase HflX